MYNNMPPYNPWGNYPYPPPWMMYPHTPVNIQQPPYPALPPPPTKLTKKQLKEYIRVQKAWEEVVGQWNTDQKKKDDEKKKKDEKPSFLKKNFTFGQMLLMMWVVGPMIGGVELLIIMKMVKSLTGW